MSPENSIWLEDGKKEYRKKNFSEAINFFNHQIRDNTKDTEAWYYKGKAWLRLGRYSEALTCFQKIIDIDKEFVKAWLRVGEIQLKMEKLEEALHTYSKGIEEIGDLATLWLGKSRVYIMVGAMVRAEETLDKVIELDPTLGEAWLEKGRLLDESGVFEGAIDCYTKATRLNKKLPDAWFLKGKALEQLGRYKEAIRCFDWTTKINLDNIEAWYRKGNSLYVLGRTKRALEAFEKVLELDPEHRDAIFKVGQIHEEMGNVKLALQYYSLADKEEGWEETLTTKGDAFFRMDKLDEALKAYDAALETNPNNYQAWSGKGKIMMINNDFEKAVECFNQSIRFESRNEETWHLKANALFNLHKYGESFTCFDKAIEHSSDNIPILLDKAMSFIALSRTKDALNILNGIVRREPDNERAIEILETMKDRKSRSRTTEIRQQRDLYHSSKESLDHYRSNIMLAESVRVDVSKFKKALNHAVREMKNQNYLGVVGIIKSNIKKLDKTCHTIITNYMKDTRELLKGLDMSVDSSHVEDILRKASSSLKSGQFQSAFEHIESTLDEIESLREMSERLSALRKQDPRYLEEARKTLKEVKSMVKKAGENDLDTSHIGRLMEKASISELKKDYIEAANILSDAKKYANNLLVTLSIDSSIGELKKDAIKAIKKAGETLKGLKTFDFIYPESEDLLSHAKRKLESKSYTEAYVSAKRSLSTIHRIEKLERILELYQEGKNLITMTKKFKNFPTDKLASSVIGAKDYLRKKKLNDALRLLEESVPSFSAALKNKALVVKLKVAQQKILKLKKLGKDTSKVQELVVKSKPAMDSKNFDMAIRYVEGALRLANKMLAVS
ncbi:MAG: tetratricopeptide repeat protein [Candidatus Thermoplasmatota archaeon]|jgi:tetratricopeptide (TPR) repeat protein|nr:tetratricopeptide repeat protein [Candidatus Thermoplasmatota archaeon]